MHMISKQLLVGNIEAAREVHPAIGALLTFPSWAVLAVPGVLLAWMGRSRRTRMFVQHDQI